MRIDKNGMPDIELGASQVYEIKGVYNYCPILLKGGKSVKVCVNRTNSSSL